MALEPFTIPGFTDPVSSLSHLIAAGVFAVLGVQLVKKGAEARVAGGPGERAGRVLSLAVFAGSAVLLLTMSGLFHLLSRGGAARDVLQRLDHAAIFVLIAGTATPIHVIMFKDRVRLVNMVIIWTIAALGVTLKSIYFSVTPPGLGVWLYIGMGWVAGLSIFWIWRRHGLGFVTPLLLGGLVYTAGAVIDWAEPRALIPGVVRAHELFHVAVIVGLGLHWRFVWSIAGLEGDEPLEG